VALIVIKYFDFWFTFMQDLFVSVSLCYALHNWLSCYLNLAVC
jgi:cellulose synthase/poly-beta-1,6-N-acetylglucosamine synthase-like glycosyltransferase